MIFVAAMLIAGLGLFFLGLQLLTDNLQALTGRRLRDRIAKLTRKPSIGLVWGGILVAVTQSMAGMSFILISMLRSAMITVVQSLPILIGGNIAAGIIVMILVFDIRAGVLIVLGIAALLFTSKRPQPLHSIAGAVLGVGLLFFGLETMHDGVSPLSQADWFAGFLQSSQEYYLAGFIVGALLSFAVQSSVAVVILTVAFYEGGVLTLEQSTMVVYGANVGASLLTLFLSYKLAGQARQIAMFQTGYNLFGAAIMLPLFYAETYLGIPLFGALVDLIPGSGGERIAVIFILFNVLPGIILFFLLEPTSMLLAKLWPETDVEQASKPMFLHDLALEDPEGAIGLVEMEQGRLIGHLSDAFDVVRNEKPYSAMVAQRDAFETLCRLLRETLTDISSQHRLADATYDRLNILMSRQHALELAEDLIIDLGKHITALKGIPAGEQFALVSLESMDAIVLTLEDLARTESEEDAGHLQVMTSDDGSIARVRESYLAQEDAFDAAGRSQLLALANLSERLIWLLGRIGATYRRPKTAA